VALLRGKSVLQISKHLSLLSLRFREEKRNVHTSTGNYIGFGEWRKLHNEELHDLYSSPSIIRIIKSRKMRLGGGHVARMGRRGTLIDYWWESQKERTTRKTKT
jgi:hypothetical protein